jgi:hypothetical protein
MIWAFSHAAPRLGSMRAITGLPASPMATSSPPCAPTPRQLCKRGIEFGGWPNSTGTGGRNRVILLRPRVVRPTLAIARRCLLQEER